MKPAACGVALVLVFTLAPYVRREWRSASAPTCLVDGSRDRTLRGKARRRARRAGAR